MPPWRALILTGLALAAAAGLLQWLEYRYLARSLPGELYIGLIGLLFVALGAWVGVRLTPRPRRTGPFARNDAAVRSLGLSPRECDILDALALGDSNKQLARRLGISPNTVKTHVARIYAKLGVSRRVQAVEKARLLALIE